MPGHGVPRSKLVGLGVLLLLANLLAYGWIYPMREPIGRVVMDPLPPDVGDWVGEHVEVDPRAYRILNADAIMQRLYRRGDHLMEWMLVVARNRRSIHSPTSCYRVAGWELSPDRLIEVEVAGAPIRWHEVRADRQGSSMIVWYTFTDGRRCTPRWLEQQWFMGLSQAKRERPVWAQAQLAGVMVDDSEEGTRQQMQAFLAEAFPATLDLLRAARLEPMADPEAPMPAGPAGEDAPAQTSSDDPRP